MMMVRKWRYHFYDVILDVLSTAGTFNFPIDFQPIEQYMDGFSVVYHDIADLPNGALAPLRGDEAIEEGWNIVLLEMSEIHIFFDGEMSEERQRFTVAHEWGHVFQKMDGDFKAAIEALPDHRERQAIIESIADHFAAEYLIPNCILIEKVITATSFSATHAGESAATLAGLFGVSFTAMQNRMQNIRHEKR